MPDVFRTIITVFMIVFSIGFFTFTFLVIFNPKVRGKFMGNQIKATKYMFEDNKEDLTDISTMTAGVVVDTAHNVITEKEEKLKDISTKAANINKEGIKTTAKAIKEGLTDSIYCKHCGASIDHDSSFCKFCGKEQ